MKRALLDVAIKATVLSLLCAIAMLAQVSSTAKKAATVHITEGPSVEWADPDFAIIRWTSNNPGGSPQHLGVVHYGTDPMDLSQTAKSHIRLNPGHPLPFSACACRDLSRTRPTTTPLT